MIYHTITAENPLIPRNSSNGMQTIRNMKLTLLSFQEHYHYNKVYNIAMCQQKIFATYD